ncbi:hypothetical protein AA0472_2259 [Acetobacter estunensis NRIC 0472]|nr:hypothetical protein [Acetobacter estunensis]GBQ26889.1 hypothetical protein AA0472_2259 [Acetobacter estunensis NRIC 0472]
MALLACGRAEGIERFGGSVDSLLSALAPGLAMCLVGFLTVPLQKQPFIGLVRVELSFCTLLALPVISHALARRWGREKLWLRYATAAVWCEWVTVLVSIVALLLGALMFSPLASSPGFGTAVVLASDLYGLWLGVFVARKGLALGWGRAIVLYGATFVFALVCYGLASFLPPHYNFVQDLLQPGVLGGSSSE